MEEGSGEGYRSQHLLGGIVGRKGAYFLKRGAGERTAFLLGNHMLYTTNDHVKGL